MFVFVCIHYYQNIHTHILFIINTRCISQFIELRFMLQEIQKESESF